MGYPVAYRQTMPIGIPKTGRAFKAPARPPHGRPANDNIGRPPRPANDNIPRVPSKPANDNFKPPVQRMNGRRVSYGWIRGAGLIGNLGGFATGSPLDIFNFLQGTANYVAENSLATWTVPEGVQAPSGWSLRLSCTAGPVYRSGCALYDPCPANLFDPSTTCNPANRDWNTYTNAAGPSPTGIANFQWKVVEAWRYNPVGNPSSFPVHRPAYPAAIPTYFPFPSIWKWIDPLSWPVAANDPGAVKITHRAIRARKNQNRNRVITESFVRGYSHAQLNPIMDPKPRPNIIDGTGQVEVPLTGKKEQIIKRPNQHLAEPPRRDVKERKVRINRAAAIVLGIVNEATEAVDMLDCLFRALPYARKAAYAKWRRSVIISEMKALWPSITQSYVDYLQRRYRRNKGFLGQQRNVNDIRKRLRVTKGTDSEVKREWVVEKLPANIRDDVEANIGPVLSYYLKRLDGVSAGNTSSGFTVQERLMLIDKHFDEIDWFSLNGETWDPSKGIPTIAASDQLKGALPCMMAQGIDDIISALPGMTAQQAYKYALDAAGIKDDRVVGLEFGPAYNP